MLGDVSRLKLKLFEGHRGEVEAQVNAWLKEHSGELVAVGYNYQGPELDGKAVVSTASHGILLLVDVSTSQ